MTLPAGTRLGPYEVLAPLGAGGMGEVYRARDPRLQREVAVKVLPAGARDPDQLRRLEQEARAAGSLNHPNVLAVFDIGSAGGSTYVVSELLEGETLRQRLAGGPLPPRKLLEFAGQIAYGLAAAHDKGIVHRDLKPENLFVTADGRIKILDFGLARIAPQAGPGDGETGSLAAGTQPGTVMGTVGYMAPEQVRGQPADARSDIFSLGAVLYEMVAGRRAFKGETAAETMTAILREDPKELALERPELPPALERVVRRCLEKLPAERFQSARDIAFALEALSVASLAPLPPARRRRRLLPALLALALLASYALVFAWARRGASAPPVFTQLTFRRGAIRSARFAPDGQTIVFSAAWEGTGYELLSARVGNPEWRSLGLPEGHVASISASGEMALLLQPNDRRFRLARAPLGGGAPREVHEQVTGADWAPDGESLAITLSAKGIDSLEFPVGKKLIESSGYIGDPRVSPRGDRVAFVGHPGSGTLSVGIVDRAGKTETLSDGWPDVRGLGWAPGADEVWFAGLDAGGTTSLNAVSLSARRRVLARLAGSATLLDVFRDGRVLLTRDQGRVETFGLRPGETRERDLTWLDGSWAADLSADGTQLLISEEGAGGGTGGAVYLRKTDGSPAVRLGAGTGFALSPDGQWALALSSSSPSHLVLLPTGPGEPKHLSAGKLAGFRAAVFVPSGDRVFFMGPEAGGRWRCWVQDLAGGMPRPVSPEGVYAFGGSPVSPDGSSFVAASEATRQFGVYPLAGGEPRPIPGLKPGEQPLRWSADGRSLFIARDAALATVVERVAVESGRREPWREIRIADPVGLAGGHRVLLTPDGSSYVHSYGRVLSELYLVEGLR